MATHPQLEIAPSILAADFAALGEAVRSVERTGVRLIHVDVMDGHFVPNISIGVPVVASLRKATRLDLDVHLMIESPERYIGAFAQAGANWITVHQEATAHLNRAIAQIREQGCRAGGAINPGTPVSTLGEVLQDVDLVLVMSVNPGFGGQSFWPGAERKIAELRELRMRGGLKFLIEVDGGITAETIAPVVRSGADILVAGTSVFHKQDPAAAVQELQRLAGEALLQRA
ncbi:MAG: ribulose-phosphate 3-epimerase [Acidobacteriia bacterium]|nr:ribulose-phosphate 3-epimerase [Terriglobia bacterium]